MVSGKKVINDIEKAIKREAGVINNMLDIVVKYVLYKKNYKILLNTYPELEQELKLIETTAESIIDSATELVELKE